jgi:hypothetical protein
LAYWSTQKESAMTEIIKYAIIATHPDGRPGLMHVTQVLSKARVYIGQMGVSNQARVLAESVMFESTDYEQVAAAYVALSGVWSSYKIKMTAALATIKKLQIDQKNAMDEALRRAATGG